MPATRPSLAPIFRSDTQMWLLAALLLGPDRDWSVTELAHHVDAPVATVSRELKRLRHTGLVTEVRRGNTKLVHADRDSAWVSHLTGLLDVTVGPVFHIADVFASMPGVTKVVVFGSWAARNAGHAGPAPHDVDVLLIGDGIDDFAATVRAGDVTEAIGLDVQTFTVSATEWDSPEPDSMVATIKQRPHLVVFDRDLQESGES